MSGSPLGKYSDIAAAIVAIAVVLAAIAAHIFPTIAVTDVSWLDNAALIAIGVVLGQRSTTNGAASIANAANARLDAIGAPPASAAPPVPKAPPPA